MDRRWWLAGLVACVALGAGLWHGWQARTPPQSPGPAASVMAPAAPSTTPTILVHVTGWVVRPGLVELREGARVGDAIAAAGGVRPGAGLAAVNLASALVDGQQVVVPGPGADPASLPPAAAGDPRIHLNRAGADELEALPGVGPVLAERIVAHREARGPFQSVEDLLEVAGIGESKLASIRDLVVVP